MAERVEIDIIARTEKAVAGLGKLVKSLSATYLSYRALKDFLVGSFKEALEAEQAFIALGASLRASGQNAEVYTKQLSGLARALSMTSTFAEEETMAAMQSLTQIGRVSAEGMKKVIPVVQDMAAALGMDLNSAALLVGKAIEGNVGALSRYGLKIKEASDPAERFSNIIQALTERFGGMSEAMAKSAGGGLKQIKNEFDELKEAVGNRLLQAFKGTILGMASLVKSNVIMATDIRDVGSAEEATAYVKVLQRELERLREEKKKNPEVVMGAYGAGIKTLTEQDKRIQAVIDKIEGLRRASINLNRDAPKLPDLLTNITGDEGGDGKKTIEELYGITESLRKISPAMADMDARWASLAHHEIYGFNSVALDKTNQSMSDMADRWTAMGEAMDPVIKDFSDAPSFNFLGGSSPEEMEAFYKKQEQYISELASQWLAVADAAVAFGSAIASGDVTGAIAGIIEQASRAAIAWAIPAAAKAYASGDMVNFASFAAIAGIGIVGAIAAGVVRNSGNGTEVSAMAEGGIVTSPRLALIGERGPEAVVPLGRGLGGTTIIVQGSVWSERDLARAIAGVQARW